MYVFIYALSLCITPYLFTLLSIFTFYLFIFSFIFTFILYLFLNVCFFALPPLFISQTYLFLYSFLFTYLYAFLPHHAKERSCHSTGVIMGSGCIDGLYVSQLAALQSSFPAK